MNGLRDPAWPGPPDGATPQSGLLPRLHDLQRQFGWIGDEQLASLARELNLSLADAQGVVSFYHYFRRSPPGEHVIHLCRAEACQASGARVLEAHACRRLDVGVGGTSPDGRFTLESVYCLGNCAMGPSILLDDELHACVTPEAFDALIDGGPL